MLDLRSDTVTKPTAAMRRAMAEAEVGDDVLDGDPTVMRLQAKTAELLGKESALFFPTGTMANLTALMVLGRPGTELLVDADAHIVHQEMAGSASLAGLQLRALRGSGPVFDASALRAAFRMPSIHFPQQSVLAIENTHNGAGGKVTSLAALAELRDIAHERRLAVHLDGARLWNATAATGTSLADFSACGDTVMVSFAKGLGAPVGAALAGTRDAMAAAWVARKRFGGGMRQSGVLAAAALHGIEHHLPRIADDHARAKEFAALVAGAGGVTVVAPDTNIVMLDLPHGATSIEIAARAKERGVLISAWTTTRLRAVMHLDVDATDVKRAAEIVAQVLEEMRR
ncbi:MAG: aminotransferase class I/II-fold pyridoxal phosphate-dependent enzyme [Gemmatimonadota bacterium]|nr:aminotransferase class I/II-fold pyridoxal phosphate-dependent enzyme [Gemmatimonadota bacterium]